VPDHADTCRRTVRHDRGLAAARHADRGADRSPASDRCGSCRRARDAADATRPHRRVGHPLTRPAATPTPRGIPRTPSHVPGLRRAARDRRRRYCDACREHRFIDQAPQARERAAEVLTRLRAEGRDPRTAVRQASSAAPRTLRTKPLSATGSASDPTRRCSRRRSCRRSTTRGSVTWQRRPGCRSITARWSGSGSASRTRGTGMRFDGSPMVVIGQSGVWLVWLALAAISATARNVCGTLEW
jgi:hypothetical protein